MDLRLQHPATGLSRLQFSLQFPVNQVVNPVHQMLKLLCQNPDLVVRVTGFTAYFASLSPIFRQLVVDRFLYGT